MTDTDEDISDLEKTIRDGVNAGRNQFNQNSRVIILSLVGVAGLTWAGVIDPPFPSWAPIAILSLIVSFGAGKYGATKISGLIDDPNGIYLISFDLTDEKPGSIYEIQPKTWEKMEVKGSLYQWDTSKIRAYEASSYDAEENKAVGNWREGEPASTFAAETDTQVVYDKIKELRESYERDAAEARELRRRIRGIIRRLDRARDKARNRQLDTETVDQGMPESVTIGDILDDELPEDLHPLSEPSDAPTDGRDKTDGETDDEQETDDDGPMMGKMPS